jgi:hypothetical protein
MVSRSALEPGKVGRHYKPQPVSMSEEIAGLGRN